MKNKKMIFNIFYNNNGEEFEKLIKKVFINFLNNYNKEIN